MRRWLFLALGVLVSGAFLFLGFRGLQWGELWAAIQNIQAGWLLAATAVYFVAAYVITWRWYYLLRPVQDIPANRLFPVVLIGYTGNNIYPFRIGELVRAYVLYRREGTNITASLTTIVVERVFDGITMLIFVFVALLSVPFADPLVSQLVAVLTVLFVAALAVFFALALRPAFTRRLYTAIFARMLPDPLAEKFTGLADSVMGGLETLRSPRDLALTFGASLLTWTIEASTYWIVLLAFPFEVSFFVLLLCVGLGNLMTILPATPGYVGTFHGVVTLVLVAFAVPQTLAAAYAVVMHAVLWAPVTLAGVIFFLRMGLRWRDFSRAEALAAAASDEAAAESA